METVPPKPFQDPAAELPSVGRGGPRLDRMLQLPQEIRHAEFLFPAGRRNQELLNVEPAADISNASIEPNRHAFTRIAALPGAMTRGLTRVPGGSWGRFRDGIGTMTTGRSEMVYVEMRLICASGRPLPRDQEVRSEPEKSEQAGLCPACSPHREPSAEGAELVVTRRSQQQRRRGRG
jgi:hypothetical protein